MKTFHGTELFISMKMYVLKDEHKVTAEQAVSVRWKTLLCLHMSLLIPESQLLDYHMHPLCQNYSRDIFIFDFTL